MSFSAPRVCLAAVLAILPGVAHAAGRLPASTAVVVDPHEAKNVVVPTTFGLLVSRDGGDTWRWVCEKAIGAPSGTEVSWLVSPKGTLVGATGAGMVVSRDGGCSFTKSDRALKAIVSRSDGELVGVESAAGMGGLNDNHLVVSKDDAQSFSASGGPIDPAVAVDSLAVAASDPVRIYLAGTRGDADTRGERVRSGAFLASYDGGMSWAPRKLELASGETPVVAGVDPSNADRVYVRTTGGPDVHARLFVTDDAGKTWRKIVEAPSEALGFALAEDGKRVFVGTKEGVSASPTDNFAFVKGSSIDAQCLALRGATLWACSTERSGFLVGSSRTGGRSFDGKLHLDEIKGPLECPAETAVAKECPAAWTNERHELGLPDTMEAPRTGGSSGPALRGRATRQRGTVNMRAAAIGIALFGFAAYSALKRLRRRP